MRNIIIYLIQKLNPYVYYDYNIYTTRELLTILIDLF